jgi:hypothetical protein
MSRNSILTAIEKSWTVQRLSLWASIGLALVVCSKLYYLFGTDAGNKPIAPMGIILLRDLFSVGFLGLFGWLTRKTLFQDRLFWGLFLFGFLISLLQLTVAKDLATWSQHYIRNIMLPMLFYPVFRGLFQLKAQIQIRSLLIWIFGIGICLSYAQVFFTKGFVRPTGIFGDPIINSMFLFWGFISVALTRGKISILLASVLLIPMVQYLSSLSALISVILGAATIFLISENQWLEYCQKNKKKVLWSLLGGLVLAAFLGWVTSMTHQQNSDQSASEKAQALFNSAFCKQEGCQHWSYKGRIESNLRPLRFCKADPVACFTGNIREASYERIESSWGSLVVNWGIIFCIVYFVWAFRHLRSSRSIKLNLTHIDPDLITWHLIFFSCLIFCLFNVLPYKFPVNILWYASMAFIAVRAKPPQKI